MVYPEKPTTRQQSWRLGTDGTPHSREKKFRVSRHSVQDYWQDNVEHWVKDDDQRSGHSTPRNGKQQGSISCNSQNNRQSNGSAGVRSRNRRIGSSHDRHNGSSTRASRERQHASSHCSKASHGSTSSSLVESEFVHHPGFSGNTAQPTNLKYKFGKKKGVLALSDQPQQAQGTFRPKGFGSLYDEMEFERRYKKVFDLNKHIHFVHSNFVTGQRIMKRTKLPPIGQVSSSNSEQESGDIFAIMSVQKYNHPDSNQSTSPTTPKYASRRNANRSPTDRRVRRPIEIAQSVNVPIGFVPGTIKPSGMSPFNGVVGSNEGNSVQKDVPNYRLRALSTEEDSAVGTLTEYASNTPRADEYLTRSARSQKTINSKKTRHSDDGRVKSELRKSRLSHTDRWSEDMSETADDPEPFNISVHVEIKQREDQALDEEDEEQDNTSSPVQENQVITNGKLIASNTRNGNHGENILHPAKIDFGLRDEMPSNKIVPKSDRIIHARNISTTVSDNGSVQQKFQYPERFNIAESLGGMSELPEESESIDDATELDHDQAGNSGSSGDLPHLSRSSTISQKTEPEK